jgi:membrane-bound lytic murein transglycosylase D
MRLDLIALAVVVGLAGIAAPSHASSAGYQLEASVISSYSIESFKKLQDDGLVTAIEHVDLGTPQGSSFRSLDFDAPPQTLLADPLAPALEDAMGNIDFSMPPVRTAKVDRHVQFFSYQIRDRFEQWLTRLERYRPRVHSIFSEFKLPDDLIFLSLVESGFNTNAVSRAKAVGPWQFMKPTAKSYGLRVDNWVDERRDPDKSTMAAAQYLRDLYQLFGSWPLAMAAYNAGEGKVGRSMARLKAKDGDFWDLLDTKLLRAETKEYVPRFVAAAQIAKDPSRFGFNILPQAPVEFDEVAVTRQVHLKAVAKAAGVTLEDIKNLNPELRREMTPPDPVYILKVPLGTKTTMMANLPAYQSLYPAIFHEPKRALLQARGKHKIGVARLAPHARHRKPANLALKSKADVASPQILAQASR